ncbi:uroporphyrinogen-III C-methyltransferase [Colwellia psychrerythraea]|uniref:Putative uroporphyrin-III C-methyltransferase n=1 Tax=Colwellia psychrerythraea (strain 34H / ATCC BAA-681) TaxID=167879 RepID=Q48AX0_COLP3|nr:uroporphyrinogen-III C-methyltransferase [Colwellia psychrerythraea]AAZ24325.1 putative uroporphyrin-III C-methyltransferase [Colwellia psychrerythraea 34H]
MEYRIMSDNEVPKNTLSDNSDTEKKQDATLPPSSTANKTSATENDNADTKKATLSKPEPKKSTASAGARKPSPSNTQETADKPSNKTAIIALVIASVSIFASIGHYVWQQQQSSAQLLTLNQQNQQAIQQSQAQLKNSLTAEFSRQLQQQHRTTSQSQESAKKAHLDSDTQLQQLTTQIRQLEQQVSLRQPNDWLIHEAEYLVRVAARTMWLERDTKAAINLLRDADNRLKELDQPKFLPVRALINEDIESLALMPTLQNQEAILTLMALNKQVPTLMLAGVNLTEALDQTTEDLALSDNIGDWQENLAKTWHKFLNDFITVRRRTGMVEPLMAPDQQQHLKQNLSLKIQLVQWAASEQKEEIYQQTLLDIQQWLNEFFDMNSPVNKRFYQSIEQLKQQTIHYDYPSDLRSLAAIKRLLQDSKQVTKPQTSKSKSVKVEQTEKQVVEQLAEPSSAPKDSPKPESEKASGGQL